MKIKLDENLPAALKSDLEALGHDVHTVDEEGLTGAEDESVWDACTTEARFLITQDLDFSDTRRFAPGEHAGILVVRLEEPGRGALRVFVRELARVYDLEQWSACFVVATKHKVRVLRPETPRRA